MPFEVSTVAKDGLQFFVDGEIWSCDILHKFFHYKIWYSESDDYILMVFYPIKLFYLIGCDSSKHGWAVFLHVYMLFLNIAI